jgi:hypothetical protein
MYALGDAASTSGARGASPTTGERDSKVGSGSAIGQPVDLERTFVGGDMAYNRYRVCSSRAILLLSLVSRR